MFLELLSYISGKNELQQKIEMTAPVLMVYKNMDSGLINEDSNVYLSKRFYIPKVNQEDTPIPTESSVQILNEPEMIVATYRFMTDYRASMSDYINNRDLLIQLLGDQAKDYDTVNFITAGYDSPSVSVGRRNEVILKKKTN